MVTRMLSLLLLCLALPVAAKGKRNLEKAIDDHFQSIRTDPNELRAFFLTMPKGGDLHHHFSGSVFPETLIQMAAGRGSCMDPESLAVSDGPCSAQQVPMSRVARDEELFNALVNAWSLRGLPADPARAHDHFFSIFSQLYIHPQDVPAMLAILCRQADQENIGYLETMITPSESKSTFLQWASGLSWNENLDELWDGINTAQFRDHVSAFARELSLYRDETNRLLNCQNEDSPGCDVTLRFQVHVIRVMDPILVFAQTAVYFVLAAEHPELVLGVNIVGPEDNPIAMADYNLHMSFLEFFRAKFPKVHRDFHAGELVMGMVPPTGLRDHIRLAVERGGAQRIGHGTDISYEIESELLLGHMAQQGIAVELPLVSNRLLMGIQGKSHPLLTYLSHGVPVVLATDDAGLFRTDLTEQFVTAALSYPSLRYADFKKMVRNSLEYSFLPGSGLWANRSYANMASDCGGKRGPGADCESYLNANFKAQLQWELEAELSVFERECLKLH